MPKFIFASLIDPMHIFSLHILCEVADLERFALCKVRCIVVDAMLTPHIDNSQAISAALFHGFCETSLVA